MPIAVLLALAFLALSACSSTNKGPRIQVRDVWSRPMNAMASPGKENNSDQQHPTGSNGVVYLTLVNKGNEADRLLGARSDVATAAELHQTKMTREGAMKMEPVRAVDVPAGGKVEFKPGGYHIMLIGLTRDLTVGDRFDVILAFKESGEITVQAEVRAQ